MTQRPIREPFDEHAHQPDDDAGDDERGRDQAYVAERPAKEEGLDRREEAHSGRLGHCGVSEQLESAETHVAAGHEQFAVREVDHEQDAVHQRVAQGDERVEPAQGDAVDGLLEEITHGERQAELPVVRSRV
jgi:hypothetical protein